METVRQAGLLALLVYISVESLIKSDNAKALLQAEGVIDKLTNGKLEESHPGFMFVLLSTLNLIGVFAPVAIYLRKYCILLLCFLLVTRSRVFLSNMDQDDKFYHTSANIGVQSRTDNGIVSATSMDLDGSRDTGIINYWIPNYFTLATFGITLVVSLEAAWSVYKPPPVQLGRQFDSDRLYDFMDRVIHSHRSSTEGLN